MGDFAGGLLLARELIPPAAPSCAPYPAERTPCACSTSCTDCAGRSPLHWPPPTTTTSCVGRRPTGTRPSSASSSPLCCGRDRLLQPDGTWRDLPPVELFIGGGDVSGEARRRRRGVEETARDMRYDFLRRTARTCGAQWIATAHNAGDNAETILLHLIRGPGCAAWEGSAPVRGCDPSPAVRLGMRSRRISASGGCPGGRDATNRDDAYTRNRLRHRVLPELEAISPA